MRKRHRIAVIAKNGTATRRKPRKRGEITKLKEKLWLLCRQITKKRYGNVCYTSGKTVPDGKGLHTGHYITSSTCSIPLRYDIRNLRPQSFHDNINLSGNWPAFHKRMEQETPGITAVLLAENEATKGKTYNKQWFLDKISEYETLLQRM